MRKFFRICTACLLALWAPACSDLGADGAVDELEISPLGGHISANMMPMIPPEPTDRISASFDLLVRNPGSRSLSVALRVARADVRLYRTRTRRGTLYFSTTWDGILEPFAADTVRLVKQGLSRDFLQPECGGIVDLDFEIGEAEGLLVRFTSGPVEFSCVY